MGEAAVAMAVADAAAESEKAIVRDVTVPLPLAEVWRMWTTSAGLESWLVPEARVELRAGGRFELLFLPDTPENRGTRGSEGCTFLTFLPESSFETTWNAPPQFPAERRRLTRLLVEMEPTANGQTHLRLTQFGWPIEVETAGSNWNRVYAYFDRAWTQVIRAFAKHAKQVHRQTPRSAASGSTKAANKLAAA